MRIRVLLNLGSGWPRFMADEVHEVDDQVGRMLVERTWAIELPPEPVVVADVHEPAEPDKFQALREHSDHLTQKTSSRRKRAEKPSTEEGV